VWISEWENQVVPGLLQTDEYARAVIEVGADVDSTGPHPVAVPPLAPEMLGLVQAVTAYEVLAGQAARTGDRDVALRALLANPLVRQWDVAVPLLGELLEANRAHLPQFFGAGR
jgi:6-phospho-beta-glucosidase